jgi:hypothetical protein
MSPDANEYIFLNVGTNLSSNSDGNEYVFENVGTNTPSTTDGTDYVYIDVLQGVQYVGWGLPL